MNSASKSSEPLFPNLSLTCLQKKTSSSVHYLATTNTNNVSAISNGEIWAPAHNYILRNIPDHKRRHMELGFSICLLFDANFMLQKGLVVVLYSFP